MSQPWNLSEMNQRAARALRPAVAVLPVGATEAHNLHLPEGQDVLQAVHVAHRCCAAAAAQGARLVCLPAIPYGVDCELMSYPLTIHVRQATLDALVADIVAALERHGVRKTLILNGHGGNEFVPLIRQLQYDRDVHVFLCNWWTVGMDRYDEIFAAPEDHAGELETSVGLALHPELVDLPAAGDGQTRGFRFEALRKGWVRTTRDFAQLNDHAGVGDPAAATAEKGRVYLDLVCERLTRFLVELAAAPLDEHFPLAP